MNRAAFLNAQNAYELQDYSSALKLFNSIVHDFNYPLKAGEYGLVYHRIGNCLVKLKDYPNAINAYSSSISDNSYISQATVYYNLGMVYSLLNDFNNASINFNKALDIPTYRSKYKAYTALGNCLMKKGKPAEAAVSFRKAALENNNPDPTRALSNLGVCFMALNRSQDAISVYESAFEFNMSKKFKNRLYANLGQAYAASGQMNKAVDAFENAIRDKTYVLSDSASVDYQRAIALLSKGKDLNLTDSSNERVNDAKVSGFSATDIENSEDFVNKNQTIQFSKKEIQNNSNKNYDLAGFNTNSYSADADQPAFVQTSVDIYSNADDAIIYNKNANDIQYKNKKSSVRKYLFIILMVVCLLIIASCILYVLGFGFPTQEMVVNDLFSNPSEAKNTVFANIVEKKKIDTYCAMIPSGSSPTINGLEKSVNESVVYVKAQTQSGGDIQFKIRMARDVISWKIISVDLAFASKDY